MKKAARIISPDLHLALQGDTSLADSSYRSPFTIPPVILCSNIAYLEHRVGLHILFTPSDSHIASTDIPFPHVIFPKQPAKFAWWLRLGKEES